jgi:hypothetical protein
VPLFLALFLALILTPGLAVTISCGIAVGAGTMLKAFPKLQVRARARARCSKHFPSCRLGLGLGQDAQSISQAAG